MSTITHPRITPEELLKLPDSKRYELVEGELIEALMSAESVWVVGRLFRRLDEFCDANGRGLVLTDGFSYQCFPEDEDRIRRPNVSFVSPGRMTQSQFESGHGRIPPDLAAEVVSPNDLFYDVDRKANEYLQAGVKLVWVLNPDSQTIFVYHPDGTMAHLNRNEVLDGETVLPGFQCPVSSLFPDKSKLGLLTS